jgi:hypothetical protein
VINGTWTWRLEDLLNLVPVVENVFAGKMPNLGVASVLMPCGSKKSADFCELGDTGGLCGVGGDDDTPVEVRRLWLLMLSVLGFLWLDDCRRNGQGMLLDLFGPSCVDWSGADCIAELGEVPVGVPGEIRLHCAPELFTSCVVIDWDD